MKKIQIAAILISLVAAISASASITISGSDFNNNALVGSANGTYVSTPSGHMHLSYSDPAADAVVGAKGPFGALSGLNMSFDYSNLIGGNGNQPYAAFGVSLDGTWGGSAQEFLVIAMSGNQITGNTLVHVWDETTQANVSGLYNVTLDSILGVDNTYNNVAFGDLEVMRAYAYIGDWPGVGNVSVDINSITVSTVPEPTTMLAGALLLLPFGASAVRILRRRQAA